MAHKSVGQVTKLCHLLDDCRNDIYVHIDAKVSDIAAWKSRLQDSVHASRLIFVPSVSVNWGGYSQIAAELSLLHVAVKDREHGYYHLISGADLPLRSQDDIHSFFDAHSGEEFVQFGTSEYQKTEVLDRVRYWYVWQEFIGRAPDIPHRVVRKIQSIFLTAQHMLNIDINRHNEVHDFYGGANWFSVTEAFAGYILDHEHWIHDTFRRGKCVDEIFIQTLLLNSPFAERRYLGVHFDDDFHSIVRDIDWNRGGPYVWRTEDFDELMTSDFLFARKFDESVDAGIIDRIYEKLLGAETKNSAQTNA